MLFQFPMILNFQMFLLCCKMWILQKMWWLQMQLLPTVDLSVTCTIPASQDHFAIFFQCSSSPPNLVLAASWWRRFAFPNLNALALGGFCFLQFCDVAKLANHPQEELPKFGYRSGRNVEIWSCWSKSDCGFCWNGCQQLIWEAVEPSCCWEEHSWVHSQGIRSTIHTYIHRLQKRWRSAMENKQLISASALFLFF